MLREIRQRQQQFVLDQLAYRDALGTDQQRLVLAAETIGFGFALDQRQSEVQRQREIHGRQAALTAQMQKPVDVTGDEPASARIASGEQPHVEIRYVAVMHQRSQPFHPCCRQGPAILAARGRQGCGVQQFRQPISHKRRIITVTSICVKTKNAGNRRPRPRPAGG